VSASFPSAIKSFVTRTDGPSSTISASHVNDLQDEVTAIETAVITGPFDVLGGQVKFPAVQNPSANANTLDDYEEGVWTPVVQFGGAAVGITYSTQTGAYIKIGKLVTVFFSIALTSKGSSVGTATFTGLPFAAGATHYGGLFGATYTNMSGLGDGMTGSVNPGGTSISPSFGAATGSAALADTNFSNTTLFIASATYLAAN
jgi:hypothetical protein